MSQTKLMGEKNRIVSDCIEGYIQNDLNFQSQVTSYFFKFHMILFVFIIVLLLN